MGYMAVEYLPDHIDAESEKRLSKASEIVEDNEILARELTDSLREQDRLAKSIQLLESKVSKREDEIQTLSEDMVTLAEEKETMLFESTEQAVVITKNVDEEVINEDLENMGNEFLTEEMLKLMR